MDQMLKAYLDRAAEIIGERTAGEVAHDNAVIDALDQGRPIEEALAIAGAEHPSEAILWDEGNVGDIASHYDYLREHRKFVQMMGRSKKASGRG